MFGYFLFSFPGEKGFYLSLTGGENLEGLDLLLLMVPGHRLRVQNTGDHRALLHLPGEKSKWKSGGGGGTGENVKSLY